MTHRVFSRNASSSRAIPVERLIADVMEDTARPIHWGKNQPGMQAHEEHDAQVWFDVPTKDDDENIIYKPSAFSSEAAWFAARDLAVEMARAFAAAGYAKQIVNRLLEPFSHINVVMTATELTNFFELRDHPDAQPEIRALAQAMKAALVEAVPTVLEPGQWHLPYCSAADREWHEPERLVRLSAARCARVSYLTHDGRKPDLLEDLALFDRLAGAVPAHFSPLEHQASPDTRGDHGWESPYLHGNLVGWRQHRKLVEYGITVGEIE